MKKSIHEAAADAARSKEGRPGAMTVRIRELATRLGCTEGQVYSMAIGLTVATMLTIVGGVPIGKPHVASAAPGLVATPELPGTVVAPPPPDLVAPEGPLTSVPPALPGPYSPPPAISPGSVGPLPETPTDPPIEPSIEPPTPEGVTVVKAAWYSATGPADPAPEEALPVAAALGQTRNLSVITLKGKADELLFQETDDAQTSPETAAINLCPLGKGETYEQATGQTLLDAPAYDCTIGVDGVRDSSGGWTFPLLLGKKGGAFALVPQSATPLVTFTVYLTQASLGDSRDRAGRHAGHRDAARARD